MRRAARATPSRCASSTSAARRASSPTPSCSARPTASRACSTRSASSAASACSCSPGGSPSCTSRRSARSSTAACSARCSRRSAPSRSSSGCGSATRACSSRPPRSTAARSRSCASACRACGTCCSSASQPEIAEIPGVDDFRALMSAASDSFEIAATRPRTWRCCTSRAARPARRRARCTCTRRWSPTARPARLVLDLRPGDVFWCTADPGWVTGTSYGIIAPLTLGVTSIVDEADFEADRWYRILQDERVNVWYTAPTALRMLMRVGAEVAREYDLSSLRFVASVGEPLNPEVVVWGEEAFGMPVHDNWWQTETGGIMIANYRSMDVRPGSMGRPLPGIEAAVARRDEDDRPVLAPDGTLELVEDRRGGRARAAPGLAVDVPRLPRRGGALPQVLRRRLVPDRRPRAPRRRRLLLVRRPRRRRDQVRRAPDRAVRGRERAARAPGRRRGRRDRQARPGCRRDREGVRRPRARATSRARSCAASCSRSRASGSARPSRRARSTSSTPSRTTAAARSCAALLKARELGLPEGDISTLEPTA